MESVMHDMEDWMKILEQGQQQAVRAVNDKNFGYFQMRTAISAANEDDDPFDDLETKDKSAIVGLNIKAAEDQKDIITEFKSAVEDQKSPPETAHDWESLVITQKQEIKEKSTAVIDNLYDAAETYIRENVEPSLRNLAVEFFTKGVDTVMTLIGMISEVVKDVVEWVVKYLKKMAKKVKEAAKGIYEKVDNSCNTADGYVKSTVRILKTLLPFVIPVLAGNLSTGHANEGSSYLGSMMWSGPDADLVATLSANAFVAGRLAKHGVLIAQQYSSTTYFANTHSVDVIYTTMRITSQGRSNKELEKIWRDCSRGIGQHDPSFPSMPNFSR